MKINCACGDTIVDVEASSHQGMIWPSENFFPTLDAIDAIIESVGPSPAEKEAALMKVRHILISATRGAWQCLICARLYIDLPGYELTSFVPADKEESRGVLGAQLKRPGSI